MGDYNRTTRECSFSQLQPETLLAFQKFAEAQEIMDLESSILKCIETTSEKKKKGLFASLLGGDPDPVHYTSVVLTPTWLVWVRSGPKSGTSLLSARLAEIEIVDMDPRLKALGAQIDDEGMTVLGFVNQSPERVSAFIGLGKEPAAQQMKQAVKAQAAQVKG